MLLQARGRTIHFPRRPLIMAIVNINDDSFCGDGTLDPAAALAQAIHHATHGADIIDAGAESARTNRPPITPAEEIHRFTHFITAYTAWAASVAHQPPPFDSQQVWPPLLSLNTWRPEVIAAILPHGGHILNDIGALPDDTNARLCAQHGAALLIMHSIGLPKEKHLHIHYPDIIAELLRFFTEKLQLAHHAGLSPHATLLDPGIDFAKQTPDNLTILRDLPALHSLARPLLLPISRKTTIGQILNLPNPLDRDPGTLACLARGHTTGAHLFRIHHTPTLAPANKTLYALSSEVN